MNDIGDFEKSHYIYIPKNFLGFNRNIKSDSGPVNLMFVKQSPVALRPFTIILMLIMLLFATVADAATCGSEFASSGAAEMDASSPAQEEASSDEKKHDGQSSPADQHGICGHGHHHNGSNISETAHVDHIGHQLTLHGPTDSSVLVSGEKNLLKRPPRV